MEQGLPDVRRRSGWLAAGYDVLALERKEREDGEDITSGEVMVVPTQNECAQLGVKFEGDWVLDRITGFRNVYPDLSWTYHPIPMSRLPGAGRSRRIQRSLRRRLVEAGGRLVWNARVTDLEFRDDNGPQSQSPPTSTGTRRRC